MDKEKNILSLKRDSNDIGLTISITLLSSIFFSYSFTVISFYWGSGLTRIIFPLSVIAGIVTGISVDSSRNIYQRILWICVVLILIAASICIGGIFYDYSYDGLRYHQEIVASICEGWNPFDRCTTEFAPKSVWSLHYAKAIEIAQAAIACFTGKIETGKSINLIIIASVSLGVFSFLRKNPESLFIKDITCGQPWSRKKSFLITLAIIGNPVVISQSLTFYIDFYKYIYLLTILLSFYLIQTSVKNQRLIGYIMLGMGLVLAMGTKFNIFFETVLWLFLTFIWLCIKKDYNSLRSIVFVSVCSLSLGTILAYHPYITNFIDKGHPLYPLMGENALDIMSENTLPVYNEHNRLINFFISLFSLTSPIFDQRAGGFTFLMPVILLFCFIIGWRVRKLLRNTIWYITGCIFLSCFIFEQTWWARYICQLWLVGAIFLIASQCVNTTKKVGFSILSLMLIAAAITTISSLYYSVTRGYFLQYLFEACRMETVKVAGDVPQQIQQHFDEKNISYIRIENIPTEESTTAIFYNSYECQPVIILSKKQFQYIEQKLTNIRQSVDRYKYVKSEKDNR